MVMMANTFLVPLSIALVCALGLVAPVAFGADSGARILQFPTNHSFGTIKIMKFKIAPLDAKGKVEIPAGARVELIVDFDATHDLSPLKNLPPDALYKLTLKKLEIDDTQLKNLENLTGLVDLDLEETDVSDEGLRWFHKLNKLDRLKLRATLVTGKGLVHLKPLTSLSDLSIANDSIGDEGLENLVGLKKLTSLNLSRSRVTDQGLKRLAPMSQLHKLDIEFNKVTDSGIASLVSLKNLRELLLSDTLVTAGCIKYLQQLPSLIQVIYSEGNFNARDAAKLSAALPHCHVEEYVKHRKVQFELFEPLH
jgi:hypothetical protein